MAQVDDTLEQRGNRYGSIEANCYVTQMMWNEMMTGESADYLSSVHRECLHMILHKIARVVNGDIWYADNVHDIAGYAKLLEDYINKENEKRDS